MLTELAVRNLGVIDEASVVIGPGMTALTGETGAGKTLLVQAIQLLTGGRADADLVGPHDDQARVEGRFELDGEEIVVARVLTRGGRSRAYVDGNMATVAGLAELGERLIDLHGQHAHQSLLSPAVQRRALDRFAGTELGPLQELLDERRRLLARISEGGGDQRSRARELDLCRFQLDEIRAAAIVDVDEEAVLARREDVLADATAHREAGAAAIEALDAESGARGGLGTALSALRGRAPYGPLVDRLSVMLAELDDLTAELRLAGEQVVEDPAALAEVRARRQQLRNLCRKYGDDLAEVLETAAELEARVDELEHHDARLAETEAELARTEGQIAVLAAEVAQVRRAAADDLAQAVSERFAELALPRARLAVAVEGPDPADEVSFRFEANAGTPALALTKVASGGELARVMLALRLVLTAGPPTLVFDEVDAGIGGDAARHVGRALARLGRHHQVLVVTHLPQVAAHAHTHIGVSKQERSGVVASDLRPLTGQERVAELARMLAGDDSEVAMAHAAELLAQAER